MWVLSEEGSLINLDWMESVVVKTTPNGFTVLAYSPDFSGNNDKTFYTLKTGTEECRFFLKRLEA